MTFDRETVRRLLERDLVEWADDADLRLVWADLLQLDGDPLGTLVVLDHVGASRTAPAEVAERARREADLLRRELGPRLWDEPIFEVAGIGLSWSLGFVREVRIDADRLVKEQGPVPVKGRRGRTPINSIASVLEWWLPRLLRQPALRWVEVIRIEIADEWAHSAVSWLRKDVNNACIREIHVGQPAHARERPSGTWEPRPAGSSRGVAGIQHHRRLRWFSVAGELHRIACCDGNTQARVHHVNRLASRPLTSQNRAALGRALLDASTLVHGAAFEVARKLGPQADFLIEDLAWFLRPPLSRKDPRPAAALGVLAAIGPAAAVLLPELLRAPDELLFGPRLLALLGVLAALGPAAAPARSLLGALHRGKHGTLPPDARAALARVRSAISTTGAGQ